MLLALTMLFSAIWLGLAFANRLVRPIRGLIRAADEVASGNLKFKCQRAVLTETSVISATRSTR